MFLFMFFKVDNLSSKVRDYSALYDMVRSCNDRNIRRTNLVQQLCETGCSRSTAYAAINKYSLTTNDRGMTVFALKYLGIGLLISYKN